MTLSGARVLVTGAGGFIGSHLVEALVPVAGRVTALVHYNGMDRRGCLDWIPVDRLRSVEVLAGDIRDAHAIRRIVAEQDIVFHLASLIGIPYSFAAPEAYVQVNVAGTLNVAQACLAHGVRRLVHTSTSEVYGTAQREPMNESHPLRPQSPYAASKVGADMLVAGLHRALGLPAVTLRPFNVYGPRQSARALLPTVITQALVGDGVKLGDTRPRRDWTYVQDTVGGFLAAATAGGVEGDVIHLGSGAARSVGDAVQDVARAIQRPLRIEADAERVRPGESEVWSLVCDARLAREKLGWAPSVSWGDGLAATIDWIRDHLDVYRVGRYTL